MPGGLITCGSPYPSTLGGFLEQLLTPLHFTYCSLSETIFQDAGPLGLVLYLSLFSFLSVNPLHLPLLRVDFLNFILHTCYLLLSFHLTVTFLLLRA